MNDALAIELVEAIAASPTALDRLRELIAPAPVHVPTARAYTPATLALELGRSERSIRDAIHRGELPAVKRGRGWVIGADAVADWTRSGAPRRARAGAARAPRGLSREALQRAMTRP